MCSLPVAFQPASQTHPYYGQGRTKFEGRGQIFPEVHGDIAESVVSPCREPFRNELLDRNVSNRNTSFA
eukprot:12627525-Heterocapsa_arctica.AAC.1